MTGWDWRAELLTHSLVRVPTVTVTRPLSTVSWRDLLTERTSGGERRGGRSRWSLERGEVGEGLERQEKAPESVWETLSDRLEAEREGEGWVWVVGGTRGRLSGETGASCNESFERKRSIIRYSSPDQSMK